MKKKLSDILDIDEMLGHRVPGDRNDLLEMYWRSHPRFTFFKYAPWSATVLDIGAGSGGLAIWRSWMKPDRRDLKLHAIDKNTGKFFSLYERTWIGDIMECIPRIAGGSYAAIMCSHVLEHLANPEACLRQLQRLLSDDGMLYVEMPTQESLDNPSRQEVVNRGFECSTLNFHDDAAHQTTIALPDLCRMLDSCRLRVECSGTIRFPFLERELMAFGMQHRDSELLTYGLWSASRFSQFALCSTIK